VGSHAPLIMLFSFFTAFGIVSLLELDEPLGDTLADSLDSGCCSCFSALQNRAIASRSAICAKMFGVKITTRVAALLGVRTSFLLAFVHLLVPIFLRTSAVGATVMDAVTAPVLVLTTTVSVACVLNLIPAPGMAGRCNCRPSSSLHSTRVAALVLAHVAPFFVIATLALLPTADSACPSFMRDLTEPLPSSPWPEGCKSVDCCPNIVKSVGATAAYLWIAVASFTIAALALVLAAQASIARQREKDALDATARMRAALHYISHEARSPLGGAILSLTLLDDAISGDDSTGARTLIADLQLSLEAAQRQLNDLLLFERVTSGSTERDVDQWAWKAIDCPEFHRLHSSFVGACRAERIELDFVVQASPQNARVAASGPIGGFARLLPSLSLTPSSADGPDRIETDGESELRRRPAAAAKESPQGKSAVAGAASRIETAPPVTEYTWEAFMDVDRVVAVVQNALSNSIKHVPGGEGSIKVRISVKSNPQGGGGSEPAVVPPERRRSRLSSSEERTTPRRSPRRKTATIHPFSPESKSLSVSPRIVMEEEGHSETRQPEGVPPSPSKDAAAMHLRPAALSPLRNEIPLAPMTKVEAAARRQRESRGKKTNDDTLCKRYLVLEVLDNGRGIPKEMLRPGRLFRPFQQLRMGDGALRMTSSGLGLSIVKSIVVDQMNGKVGLASEEHVGTLFFACIPVWARLRFTPRASEQLPSLFIPETVGWGQPDFGLSGDGGLSTKASQPPMDSKRAMVGQDLTAGPSEGESVVTPLARVDSPLSRRRTGRTPGTATPRTREERDARRQRRKVEREGGTPSSGDSPAVSRSEPAKIGTVMVVDDERVNRTLMARLLRAWGFEAVEMSDGRHLVTFLEDMVDKYNLGGDEVLESAGWPILVTLDVQMPLVDGFAVLARRQELVRQCLENGHETLAAKLQGIVVIGVTGNAVASDSERLVSLGARKVLIKPVNPTQLATCIEEQCHIGLPSKAHRRIGSVGVRLVTGDE
jgi:two-component system, cell cycle response regulator DivK